MRSPHMPDLIHFNLLAAVLRSHRHGNTLFTPGMLCPRRSTFHFHEITSPQGEGKTKTTLHGATPGALWESRIVDGNFLLKSTTYFVMRKTADLESRQRLADETHEFINRYLSAKDWGLNRVCGHINWVKRHTGCTTAPTAPTYRNLECCLLTHEDPCRYAVCIMRKDAGLWKPVHSCPQCYTDYSVLSARRAPGKFPNWPKSLADRILVVTVWKNLGQGRSTEDPCWRTHLFQDAVQKKASPHLRGKMDATICRTFEKCWESPGSNMTYRPNGDLLKDWR